LRGSLARVGAQLGCLLSALIVSLVIVKIGANPLIVVASIVFALGLIIWLARRTTSPLVLAGDIVIAAAFVIFIFPLFWILETSFKNQNDAFTIPPTFLGFTPTLLNYKHVFVTDTNYLGAGGASTINTGFAHYFTNSIILAGSSTVLALVLGTMTAYAFSRFRIKAANDILFFILSQRMLPPVVVIIPIFLLYRNLNLIDTYQGMILLYTTFNLPFAVWMMKGFMDEIPKEYEDAAMVDGYSRLQAFWKVILPQALPGMAATAVFALITVWNEFVFGLLMTSQNARPAPPSLVAAQTVSGIDWGQIAAASTLFVLPVIFFTFLVRNHLLTGVTFGAVRR
jgi:multiple sugar transport system permease protein